MAKSEKKKVSPRPRKAAKVDKPVKVAKTVKVTKPAKAKKTRVLLPPPHASEIDVLDRLYALVESRRTADPEISHSARLLSRGVAKVAQKFGEEAVECLIEAVAGNHEALVAESADVLYHLIVLWVAAGTTSTEVWTELVRREGISGIAEKAARARPVSGTSKIP